MATLDAWMTENDRDDRWLAEALACNRSQAWRIRTRNGRPSAARAFQIEKLTKGKVKAADLLTGPTAAEQSGQAA